MFIRFDDEKLPEFIKALRDVEPDALAAVLGPLADRFQERLDDEAENHDVYEKYRAAADEQGSEGDLEFDEGAVVSIGEDAGAYVMGWKWVPADGAGLA